MIKEVLLKKLQTKKLKRRLSRSNNQDLDNGCALNILRRWKGEN
jgi:hypothetical protein